MCRGERWVWSRYEGPVPQVIRMPFHGICFFLCSSGSKTADPYCYGHTQFHLLPDKLKRERLLKQNCADQIEVVFRANAIASLFAWTGAQAMYQGKPMALLFLEDMRHFKNLISFPWLKCGLDLNVLKTCITTKYGGCKIHE